MAGEPSPGVTTDDLKAAFETECQGIRDQIIAHVLGWYAIADTTASVCVRYQGRVQNVAVAIAEALGRSPRFVYNLLAISKHPSELRARVREVGMSDEQRRLLQLNALDDSLQAEALTAYGQGGGQAFDAAIQDAKGASGPIANAPLANVLAQFADPTQALGGIAAAAPDTPLPATLKEKFPELSKCKTYGDVLGMTSASNTPQPEGGTGTKPTKKGGGKGKPERDWGRGFNLHIDAEKTISLNKSEFAILLAGVFDAKGDKVEGAWVKFHVVDRK